MRILLTALSAALVMLLWMPATATGVPQAPPLPAATSSASATPSDSATPSASASTTTTSMTASESGWSLIQLTTVVAVSLLGTVVVLLTIGALVRRGRRRR